jgi:hypothetical protein
LVRVKTITRREILVLEQLGQQGALAALLDEDDLLLTARPWWPGASPTTLTGSLFSSSPASLPISVGMVAEKNRF